MSRRSRRPALAAVAIAAILLPLAVTSTPPEPPPVNVYRTGGILVRLSGGQVENIPMALAANCGFDGAWHLLRPGRNECGCVYPNKGSPVALTHPTGEFYVEVVSCDLLESLAVAVVLPDTFFTGRSFARTSAYSVEPNEQEYWEEDEGYLCSDEVNLRMVQVGLRYSFDLDTLIVD